MFAPPEAHPSEDASEEEDSEDEELTRYKVLILCLSPPQVTSTLVRSPVKRYRGLRIVLIFHPPPEATGTVPPSSPLSYVSPYRASRSALRIFLHFCFLSRCVQRDFLLLSNPPPPPHPRQSASPGPSPIARCARQPAGGPGVAAHSGSACCATIVSRTPRRGIQHAVPAHPSCVLPAC